MQFLQNEVEIEQGICLAAEGFDLNEVSKKSMGRKTGKTTPHFSIAAQWYRIKGSLPKTLKWKVFEWGKTP